MITKKLNKILKKIFPNDKIPKNIKKLTHGYFKSWDSLKHFDLLLRIEEDFKVKFSSREMARLKNLDEIISTLEKSIINAARDK